MRQLQRTDHQRRADPKQPGRTLAFLRDSLGRGIDSIKNIHAGCVVPFPRRRKTHAAGIAIDQTHAQRGFQLLQMSGDRRVRGAQPLGGGCKTLGLDDAAEHAHGEHLIHGVSAPVA
jgi:hypothetical protein